MIRVLIIEDDKITRKGLITTMPWAKHGMHVVGEAANGAAALAFLHEHEADLCFVDLMMPIMGGLEFIKRATEQYPMTEFVIVSFHEDFGAAQEAMRMGVLDYVSKLEFEKSDFEGILMRIVQKMKRFGAAGRSLDDVPWVEDLQNKKWLFDLHALDKLIQAIQDHPVAMPALERALIQVVYEIGNETGFRNIPIPELQNIHHAERFLHAFRDNAIREAKASSNTTHLMVCLLKAIALVADDCGRNLNTEDVASQIGLSRPYFSNCFSRDVGVPFNTYLRRERVIKACHLLENTELSVQEVAHQVGYGDMRYFYKIFAELTGETPANYRKK